MAAIYEEGKAICNSNEVDKKIKQGEIVKYYKQADRLGDTYIRILINNSHYCVDAEIGYFKENFSIVEKNKLLEAFDKESGYNPFADFVIWRDGSKFDSAKFSARIKHEYKDTLSESDIDKLIDSLLKLRDINAGLTDMGAARQAFMMGG